MMDHTPSRYDPDPPLWQVREAFDGYGNDRRLLHQVYVDGRLVDGWAGSVRGSAWQDWADRFDAEHLPSPPPTPAPEPDPHHVRVLRWLEGIAGGRAALEALSDEPPAPVGVPEPGPGALEQSYAEACAHLERVCAQCFDDEVLARCRWVLARVADLDPRLAAGLPPNELAGGALWLVGRANDLFGTGLTQAGVQRELWLKKQLNTCGRRIRHCVVGVDIHHERRPHQVPDLSTQGCPELMTPATRRLLIRWRDEALAAEARAPEPAVES